MRSSRAESEGPGDPGSMEHGSLDVHIEKIEEGHRLKRQQIKSWTGCSRSNEQLGPRHYLQKMILLSGAWLCTLRLREMNLKEEEEREVWHLNLDIMEGITMHQLASWPGLEVLNYLKDQVRDYLIHQEADSLVGKVLWLELHISLELHMVIQEWVVVMHRRMPPLPVVELMVVELQHILDYHMVIPQVQVDLPGQDQILPQAFMVDNLMGMLELRWLRLRLRPKDVTVDQHMAGQSQESTAPPWNRRLRRAHMTGKGVIVHLFSGADAKKWNDIGGGRYSWLCIDTEINAALNLHNPSVWSYLWKLASLGRIVAIIGGPPCRTVSRLRNKAPGPRRLRGRGEDRWCLPELDDDEQRLVHGDTALCMKHIGLWLRAQECRRVPTDVGMLLESPRDPAEYLSDQEGAQRASFWCFPEITVSASSGPPPVQPEEELLRGIRRVRRGSTESSTGTPTSTLSSTMTASTRGMDAMEAPLTLGYLGRMRGQENRGERPAPPNMQVPLEEERSDWILSLHSEGLLLARHPNLPDEATPQWLGIQMPVAQSLRPAGAGRPSEGSRPAAGSEGTMPVARASQGPMPVNEEWDSDGSYELLQN
ncbi:Retrovirus-related Pol polyprotein from transposon TNT 1-94 [Durusdinium trenchii]|uniref:Retrovirus-related Pol polyprotein from transposon TNT 1-94 n=1 Tax=Durusdinium trenchii TaxID=1381693 RepID=A0ABP0SP11_9DINO